MRNEITNFLQKSNETFNEAWERFKIAAALEDKLDIRMNRFKKSLNEMKNSFTPTAPLKAVTEGGMTVIKNDENELVPTRLVTGWRVCIDYRKLNDATRKDHFPLPFMDQMLERLAGNEYYCFLDGFSGYFQIPIDLKDQEKPRLLVLMEPLLTNACRLASAMHLEPSREV
nr:reverse transcriptase domain-containing protein [Tanacetum cinerariifolium]